MILIILTYYLKQVLSISDIQSLLSPIVHSINSGETHQLNLEDIYDKFLEIEREEIASFKTEFEDKLILQLSNNLSKKETESAEALEEGVQEDSSILDDTEKDISKLIMTVITLVVRSSIQKRMAEKIIDELLNEGK
jgi:ribosomal protein S25